MSAIKRLLDDIADKAKELTRARQEATQLALELNGLKRSAGLPIKGEYPDELPLLIWERKMSNHKYL